MPAVNYSPSSLMPLLTDCTEVCSALSHVSKTLSHRLGALARSESTQDVYEALTAAVYLMSSASNQLYVSSESRRLSFERGSWNLLGRSQTVEDMVEAGFFYLQEDDHVKCFFCDLGLKDWDVGDVPEMEHAKFSPLCFFLKSSRGLDWLRSSSPRPPNYPTSYIRQDHNQLLSILSDELQSQQSDIVTKLGFSDTKVLLCLARKFIRFRQKFSRQELLQEMHKEWDREMSGEPELFVGRFNLAAALREFRGRMGPPAAAGSAPAPQRQPAPAQQSGSAAAGNRCRHCNSRDVEIVCLPCGHLSLCMQCSRMVRVCPAIGCGQQVDNFVRAFVS